MISLKSKITQELTFSLAGFVRDYLENEKYARDLIEKSDFKKLFNEV
jgi:hypothetical protein